jgi:hypothetical protein
MFWRNGGLSGQCQQSGKTGHISRRVSHIRAPASFMPRIQGQKYSGPSPSLKFRPQSTLKLKIRRQAGSLSNFELRTPQIPDRAIAQATMPREVSDIKNVSS